MPTRCLIHIMTPIHLISSMSAIKTLHPEEDVSVQLLVNYPGAPESTNRTIGDIVKTMCKEFQFIKSVNILFEEPISSLEITRRKLHEKAKEFSAGCGIDQPDEIFYAHDVVGLMYHFLSLTYPDAKRICYGESMGMVFEKESWLALLSQFFSASKKESPSKSPGVSIKSRIRSQISWGLKKITWNAPLPPVPLPHIAALILPVDTSGFFLAQTPLIVCPREVCMSVIGRCVSATSALQEYQHRLLQEHQQKTKYLLLTDMYSESGYIPLDQDISMYCEFIRTHCLPGSTIFIKSHPAEKYPRYLEIQKKLGNQFEVLQLDSAFTRYPIELWKPLVLQSQPINISYPVLSLNYIFGTEVIQPMTPDMIQKWFPESLWTYAREEQKLYMEPLKKLKTWDGKSPLWIRT